MIVVDFIKHFSMNYSIMKRLLFSAFPECFNSRLDIILHVHYTVVAFLHGKMKQLKI